jgi:hypothetical protein
MTRTRLALVVLVVAALAGLLTVGTWAVMGASARSAPAMMATGYGPGMMDGRYGGNMMTGGNGMMAGGYGMMAGGYGLPGDGRPVTTLAAARQRAQVYADELGLRTGEVIRFSNNFYAELLTVAGAGATEVLVDPDTGAVQQEYGPAMMWNTGYGMHAGAATTPLVSAAEAARLAQRWLGHHRPGLIAGEAESFPGYYTVDTRRGGTIDGMMSVHAGTGAVWYHTWHGSFVAISEE